MPKTRRPTGPPLLLTLTLTLPVPVPVPVPVPPGSGPPLAPSTGTFGLHLLFWPQEPILILAGFNAAGATCCVCVWLGSSKTGRILIRIVDPGGDRSGLCGLVRIVWSWRERGRIADEES